MEAEEMLATDTLSCHELLSGNIPLMLNITFNVHINIYAGKHEASEKYSLHCQVFITLILEW